MWRETRKYVEELLLCGISLVKKIVKEPPSDNTSPQGTFNQEQTD